MKTLTFISCTLGMGMALSACGTDPVVLGELIAAAENGSGDDGDPEAPVEEPAPADPTASDAPVEVDPTASGAPVEVDPTASDAPVEVDPTESDAPLPYPSESYDEAVIEQILLQYCGECHEAPADAGGLSVIADVDELIALNLIIPGDKEDSAIYARMATGTMPPVSYPDQPTAGEIATVGNFIDDLE